MPITAFVFSRPVATTSEIASRRSSSKRPQDQQDGIDINPDAAIAILSKNTCQARSRGQLACALPWGHGWGWSTLPNGVWNGGEFSIFISKFTFFFAYLFYVC